MSFVAAIPILGNLIDKILPDKTARESAKAKLNELELNGELKLLLGQLEVNKVEASHPSLFVSGWRPACGWVCVLGLGYNVFINPLMSVWFTMPPVDQSLLYPVLLGMLGLGLERTVEKVKGVARR